MINKAVLSVALLLCSSFAMSKTVLINGTPIEIGEITANGSGCPQGTVTASANADNTQVAILFSQYKAVTNAANPNDTTDCNISIPLSVDPGFSVGVIDIDWRGSVFVKDGAFINFHREFFFSGSEGPSEDKYWYQPGFENFVLNDTPVFVHYSSCDGTPLIARADTAATVIGENSLFSLRSADVSAELLLNLNVKRCE